MDESYNKKMEIVEMTLKSKNQMTDIRNLSNESLQSYYEWLDGGMGLANEYIEIERTCSRGMRNLEEQKIEEMYSESRPLEIKENLSEDTKQGWVTKFLEIGRTNQNEKICINIDDNLGGIYFYGWRNMIEDPIFDIHGDVIDVHQYEEYGFVKVADNFTEFLDKLYGGPPPNSPYWFEIMFGLKIEDIT